jgi:hypothetical protein
MITSSVLADRHTEIEKLRQLSRDMMKKLEPIDELSAGVRDYVSGHQPLVVQSLTFCRRRDETEVPVAVDHSCAESSC